jgi:LysR family nitrogen assimilation transcriptional regulator
LNTTLLRRDGRGVHLTPAGEAFAEFASDTLVRFDRTMDTITGLAKGLPDTVAITLPMRTEHLLLPSLLRGFAEAAPDVTLQAHEAFSEASLKDLGARRVDASISYLPPQPPMDGCIIATEMFYAVGAPDLLGASNAPIPMAEVLSLPLIVAGPDRYLSHLHDAAAQAGGVLAPVRFCSAADAMVAFAVEGEGVAILPHSNFSREADRGELCFRQIVSPVIERPVYLGFRAGLSRDTCAMLKRIVLTSMSRVGDRGRWILAEGERGEAAR